MNACHLFLAGCATIALWPAISTAQACRGRPGFEQSNAIASAGAMVASDVRSISGGGTVGRREGPLASVAISYVVRDPSATFDTEQRGSSLGASLAYAGTEGKDGRLELCPGIGISQLKVTGDFFGATATLTQNTRRAGVSAGYTWPVTPDFSVIPFASIDYARFGGSVSGDGVELPVPDDTYYPIGIGLGAVLRQRVGLTGAVIIPTGLPEAHASFVMSLSAALR